MVNGPKSSSYIYIYMDVCYTHTHRRHIEKKKICSFFFLFTFGCSRRSCVHPERYDGLDIDGYEVMLFSLFPFFLSFYIIYIPCSAYGSITLSFLFGVHEIDEFSPCFSSSTVVVREK